jgi:hypothetical protein
VHGPGQTRVGPRCPESRATEGGARAGCGPARDLSTPAESLARPGDARLIAEYLIIRWLIFVGPGDNLMGQPIFVYIYTFMHGG